MDKKRAEIGKFVTFEKKIFGFEFAKKKRVHENEPLKNDHCRIDSQLLVQF